jgi:probable HAF family extracellular repeat protein
LKGPLLNSKAASAFEECALRTDSLAKFSYYPQQRNGRIIAGVFEVLLGGTEMKHQTNPASFPQLSVTRRSDALLAVRLLLITVLVSFAVGSTASAWAQTDVPDTKYTFTTFYPGGVEDGIHGSATGIDNAGDVVGIYLKAKVYTGYERLADGTFSSLSDPGTFATEAVGVNSSGMTIVGNICIKEECMNKTGGNPPVQRKGCTCKNYAGFLLKDDAFTQYEFKKVPNTFINGINDNGTIVGYYVPKSTEVGFIGNGNTISYKGAPTSLNCINDSGTIVGTSTAGAFEADTTGKILRALKYPGASSTSANGINKAGTVVGTFVNSKGASHGFLYTKGKYTLLPDPRDAISGVSYGGINNSGQLSGSYLDKNNDLWGFVATPE